MSTYTYKITYLPTYLSTYLPTRLPRSTTAESRRHQSTQCAHIRRSVRQRVGGESWGGMQGGGRGRGGAGGTGGVAGGATQNSHASQSHVYLPQWAVLYSARHHDEHIAPLRGSARHGGGGGLGGSGGGGEGLLGGGGFSGDGGCGLGGGTISTQKEHV